MNDRSCCFRGYYIQREILEARTAIAHSLRAIEARPGTGLAKGKVTMIARLKNKVAKQKDWLAEHQRDCPGAAKGFGA